MNEAALDTIAGLLNKKPETKAPEHNSDSFYTGRYTFFKEDIPKFASIIARWPVVTVNEGVPIKSGDTLQKQDGTEGALLNASTSSLWPFETDKTYNVVMFKSANTFEVEGKYIKCVREYPNDMNELETDEMAFLQDFISHASEGTIKPDPFGKFTTDFSNTAYIPQRLYSLELFRQQCEWLSSLDIATAKRYRDALSAYKTGLSPVLSNYHSFYEDKWFRDLLEMLLKTPVKITGPYKLFRYEEFETVHMFDKQDFSWTLKEHPSRAPGQTSQRGKGFFLQGQARRLRKHIFEQPYILSTSFIRLKSDKSLYTYTVSPNTSVPCLFNYYRGHGQEFEVMLPPGLNARNMGNRFKLSEGNIVTIRGLANSTELNDKQAKIIRRLSESPVEAYEVELSEGKEKKNIPRKFLISSQGLYEYNIVDYDKSLVEKLHGIKGVHVKFINSTSHTTAVDKTKHATGLQRGRIIEYHPNNRSVDVATLEGDKPVTVTIPLSNIMFIDEYTKVRSSSRRRTRSSSRRRKSSTNARRQTRRQSSSSRARQQTRRKSSSDLKKDIVGRTYRVGLKHLKLTRPTEKALRGRSGARRSLYAARHYQ